MYRIAGIFRGRKFSRIREKYDFREQNIRVLLPFAAPTDAMSPNFTEKTFTKSHKNAKFTKVFLLESFPLYTYLEGYMYVRLTSYHGDLLAAPFPFAGSVLGLTWW